MHIRFFTQTHAYASKRIRCESTFRCCVDMQFEGISEVKVHHLQVTILVHPPTYLSTTN